MLSNCDLNPDYRELLKPDLPNGSPVDANSKSSGKTLAHRRDRAARRQGFMWVAGRFRARLAQAGLTDFDAVMGTHDGELLRALRDRENWRLQLDDPHDGPRRMYLKKHRVGGWRAWLEAKLGLGTVETAGVVEAENVLRLELGGISAMPLVAYGDRLTADGKLESFVLTEELVGYLPLDDFLQKRFADRGAAPGRREEHLSRLIDEVATVAARFHRLGYNHRDLYCCHFFIKEPEPGRFRVTLIDLQRVQSRRYFRRRWIVKDLAQLAYSAPRAVIGRTQKMRFMKKYLGVEKLRPHDKRLIRRVLAKARRMESKLKAGT